MKAPWNDDKQIKAYIRAEMISGALSGFVVLCILIGYLISHLLGL